MIPPGQQGKLNWLHWEHFLWRFASEVSPGTGCASLFGISGEIQGCPALLSVSGTSSSRLLGEAAQTAAAFGKKGFFWGRDGAMGCFVP